MKGVCESWMLLLPQGTQEPAFLQPKIKPRSRAGSVLASPSPHISSWGSPGGSSPEKSIDCRMFVKLEPRPAPPIDLCRLWKRKRRSTLSSTVSPRDPTLYLEEMLDSWLYNKTQRTTANLDTNRFKAFWRGLPGGEVVFGQKLNHWEEIHILMKMKVKVKLSSHNCQCQNISCEDKLHDWI